MVSGFGGECITVPHTCSGKQRFLGQQGNSVPPLVALVVVSPVLVPCRSDAVVVAMQVCKRIDVDAFWGMMLHALGAADAASPLNSTGAAASSGS